MKNFLFLGTCLFALYACGSMDSECPEPLSDKDLDRVLGPVKTCHIVQGDVVEENGQVKFLYFENDPDVPENVEFSILDMKYNQKGEYAWNFWISDGDTVKRFYLFDEKDQRVGYDLYNNSRFVGRMKIETSYNWKSKEFFYKSFDIKTNKYSQKRVYQIDSSRRIIVEKNFDENLKAKSFTKYEYVGESTEMSTSHVTDLDGNIIETHNFIYRDGRLYQMIIHSTWMGKYGIDQISEFSDYDSYGNYRKRRQYYVDEFGSKSLNYVQDFEYTYY